MATLINKQQIKMATLINKVQVNTGCYYMLIAADTVVCAPNIETLLVRAAKKREELKLKKSL